MISGSVKALWSLSEASRPRSRWLQIAAIMSMFGGCYSTVYVIVVTGICYVWDFGNSGFVTSRILLYALNRYVEL